MIPDNKLQEFGTTLKWVRKAHGMNQAQLASISGLNRSYISGVERGDRNISLINIYKIAAALGVNPSRLFDSTQDQILEENQK